VNFSSIRAGVMEERDEWMVLQNWFIEAVLIPLYEAWLEMSLLSGAITMPNGSALPASKMSKFMAHSWQGRRWAWVDPLKDLKAAKMAMDENLTSPQRIAASQGVDIEDVLDEIKRFKDMLKEKGLAENDLDLGKGDVDLNPGVVAGDDGADISKAKQLADMYGVSVRAGAITSQKRDEEFFRSEVGLPDMSKDVDAAWESDGGVRRPVTLQSGIAFEAEQGALVSESDDTSSGDEGE